MVPSIQSPATQGALLEWTESMLVRFIPDRGPELRAKKPENLFDGAVFSALLEILDTEYNPSRFQQSLEAFPTDTDASQGRRRNLHIIHMGLKDLGRRNCPRIEPLINELDFQALAKEPTRAGAFDILVLFLCAACLREDDNSKFVSLVTGLETKLQQGIFQILKEVETKLAQITDSDLEPGQLPADPDDELAQEAALAQLQYEAEEAKRQAGGLKMRLDRLQDNYEDLIRKHEELQEENEQLHKQIESEVGNFDKHRLQRQLKENETLIANLENERNYLVEERDRLLKEKARLEIAAQKAETLTDENQELRSRNEDLSKKANMADNLRKKLESMKAIEADFKTLQNERVDAARLMEQLENATMRVETLKREAEAYATKMQGYEIDIANFNNQKTMYTAENAELRLRLEDLHSRSQIDEAVVRDLQEKVMMFDPSATTPTTPLGSHQATLEDELNESSNAMSMRNLELQRLQAENAVLKSSIGTETEKGQLIQEMEDLRVSRETLQEKVNDLLEKYTVSQHQLDALIQNMGKDGLVKAMQACYDLAPDTKWLMSNYFRDETYSNMRTQVLAEQNNTKQLERELAAAKEQIADKDRALLEARGDFNAVEKSSLEALAELKRTDGMLAVSLRAELEAERKKHKALRDEFENQRSQLLTAFIEKDQLRREAETANREMQRAADGLPVSTDSAKQSEKMEKLRTRYKQLQQQYEQSELKNRELDRTLKAVRAGSEAGAQKAQTDQIIKNLQRENAMIATAWYDLTSRLQSNHVVLQRRHDVPKSWLNKQRQMVNATPRK
ncbi:uncharacterized protein GGS22DRAFT_163838 [Annulohypoxylon maeteangense]|uniref:uncharacterized protein n=1 Tax=Annulohypoxylon maeteangense TaxID=1927788 RepID=UPI0020073EA3|nr:uncharacterized protein GGS22DRAFT_163838 [Annulohypoxylon maeteangense]KAI0884583.1 hypothetical protein GGS22DRAFT_163838 [Annulohypoxylon maeteangense]